MGKTRRANLGLINLLLNPFGQKTYVDLVSDRPVEEIRLRALANITIAGGAASGTLQNRGSILATIRAVELEDGGQIIQRLDTRVLKVFAEMFAPRQLSDFARFANGAAQGPSNFYDAAVLHFGAPIFGNPRELFYAATRRNTGQPVKLRLGFETVGVPRDALFSGNDRTFTVNSFSVELQEWVDAIDSTPPYLVPVYQQIAQQVITGAHVDLAIPLVAGPDRIAAIVVQWTAGDYEVADMLTNLEIKSDQRQIVEKTTDGGLSSFEQMDFGGSFPIPGYHGFNFCDSGRWGNAIDPLKDTTARLILNGSLSATGGANLVRVWAMTLRQVAGVTRTPLPNVA